MKFIDPIDIAYIVKYHKDLLKIYSTDDEQSMGWQTNSQRARFEILSNIDDLNHKSVLDVGCGSAKLYQYLIVKFPTMRYVGIDIIEEFLNYATKSIENKDVAFLKGNFMSDQLPILDYYLASGSLNYKSSDPLYIFNAISHLFNNARLGFGFNLLSFAPTHQTNIISYNTEMIFEFCKMLSKKTYLKQGYLDNDYTIFMYH